MAREDRVRPHSRCGTCAVDVGKHQGAAAVLRASSKWWMMDCDDDRSCELIALHAVECGCQERNLAAIEHCVLTGLAGDDTGVLEHIAVETEDANERCLQREIHPGLDHRRTQQSTSVG